MVKAHPLNAPHTAGLFCDMSLDGPVIGTLVIIVDRAKNLPNRKTIGKQDPYCAARLGKEAKKTTTDIRGGQTPRWDQEIRFTVHDSPDYYQLKISVFNDDKKTDLIGETWVDLRDIVVPGGGQNDLWHNLTCKGKYAGEIRIELTYYDTRPKPEKPAAKPKQGDPYSSAPNSAYHTPSNHSDARHAPSEGYPLYPEDGMESPDHHGHTPDKRYMTSTPYGAQSSEQMFKLDMDNERPPPPPAHRSTPSAVSEPRHSPGHESMLHSQTPPAMRMDVLRNEAHPPSFILAGLIKFLRPAIILMTLPTTHIISLCKRL
ncbi:hypothetical protein SLS64_000960 [Diaporthe eres]